MRAPHQTTKVLSEITVEYDHIAAEWRLPEEEVIGVEEGRERDFIRELRAKRFEARHLARRRPDSPDRENQ